MGRKAAIRSAPDWSRIEWPDDVPGPFAASALRQIKPTGFWTRWRHALVNIFKSTPAWEKEEAFYALLLAAAFADREIQKEEERELNALVARTPTLAALSDDRKSALHKRLCRLLEKDFASTVESACASLPEDMRVSAFSHAVDIVYADRVIYPQEARYLNKLVELLGIDEAKAESVATAMKEKNAF